MAVHLRDLQTDPVYALPERRLPATAWARILEMIRPLKLLDDETLARMETQTSRVEVPLKIAREIGKHLERKFHEDLRREAWVAETIPDYIRPIATLNGLWIDPALPVLNRRDSEPDYVWFASFCQICSGFSIS